MDKRTADRQIKNRLKIIEYAIEHNNIAKACRHYGISRQNFYKWKRRFEENGPAGLSGQSRRPNNSPTQTSKEVISKILYIRKNYHFGAPRISFYLKRYHSVSISSSTIQKILEKHNLNRLPANKRKYERSKTRWKRYEKQRPGHRLQVDVKFLERVPGTKKHYYQFTAIDDCTRIRVLKIYDKCNQKAAIEFIDNVINRLPFKVKTIQTDNGAEFQSKFHWHLEELNINHVYIKPRTPRLNGKVERSHRIDGQEFYQLLDRRGVCDDIHLYNKKLAEWEKFYNFDRPHGALGGQTPYERFKQKLEASV